MLLPSNYKNLVLNAFDLEKVQRHIASTMKPSELTKKIQKKNTNNNANLSRKKPEKVKCAKQKVNDLTLFFPFAEMSKRRKKNKCEINSFPLLKRLLTFCRMIFCLLKFLLYCANDW
jgi:hypothetical protein